MVKYLITIFLVFASALSNAQVNKSNAHINPDTAKLYHLEDSLLFDWLRERYSHKTYEEKLKYDTVAEDTISSLMYRRNITKWHYHYPGAPNIVGDSIKMDVDTTFLRHQMEKYPKRASKL